MKETLPIDGIEYSTNQLPVLRAVELHASVIHSLGDGLGKAMGTIDLEKANLAQIGMAIMGSLAMANTEELFGLIPGAMREVQASGTPLNDVNMSRHFEQYPQHLYPVFCWALAVNIRPFLGGSGQAWKSLAGILGLQFRQDGNKNGSAGDQSSPESSARKNFIPRPSMKS